MKTKTKRPTVQPSLAPKETAQWRKDCELIENELPALIAKHKRIRKAAAEHSLSGELRRSIHGSKILLHELARRVDTDMRTLDAFLTAEGTLTSDVIDRLAKLLKLQLEVANGRSRSSS